VNVETGEWFCHSECGRGGDVFALEMALNGLEFKRAHEEVFRLVGRSSGNGNGASKRIVDVYPYPDETADEILRALREHPEGMTRTDIREHFGKNKRSAEIERALSVLQEYGRARMVREQAEQGRPAERWFAISATP
jgi:hypothetical protein